MRFNNIQLLRVAAAVGVVLYHLGCHAPTLVGVSRSWLSFPLFAGFPVPLFFAVSGFVLAQAIRSASPGRFLFARFLRLYPGYWMALLGVIAFMRLRFFTEHHRWMIHFTGWNTITLWPGGEGHVLYFLGIEWSLVYEVFLSVAVAAMALAVGWRRVPLLTGIWLAAILVKMALWPGYLFDIFPHWTTIALSGCNVPFLLGVLVYQVKDVGQRVRWLVLLTEMGLLHHMCYRPMPPELTWACWGVAGAAAVWLAVRFRQVKDTNRLARLGDCTYGLFLFHVPLMFLVLFAAQRVGRTGDVTVLWLAGGVAIVGGLLFGRVESALHTRLRPLAKVKPREAWERVRANLTRGWRGFNPLTPR